MCICVFGLLVVGETNECHRVRTHVEREEHVKRVSAHACSPAPLLSAGIRQMAVGVLIRRVMDGDRGGIEEQGWSCPSSVA